ncbi:hypothetical protein AQUCO_07200112v1 [Aquilegia coerulea]|uniref:Uncharacterized protein n=1 Tax=Aquilegia coerulea TaxID=218851 RepID=A0A2G5CAD6_AQUCA|nr:hypothetical protein AQUCO_07200112v1 [Aquilegia coerulea]
MFISIKNFRQRSDNVTNAELESLLIHYHLYFDNGLSTLSNFTNSFMCHDLMCSYGCSKPLTHGPAHKCGVSVPLSNTRVRSWILDC